MPSRRHIKAPRCTHVKADANRGRTLKPLDRGKARATQEKNFKMLMT